MKFYFLPLFLIPTLVLGQTRTLEDIKLQRQILQEREKLGANSEKIKESLIELDKEEAALLAKDKKVIKEKKVDEKKADKKAARKEKPEKEKKKAEAVSEVKETNPVQLSMPVATQVSNGTPEKNLSPEERLNSLLGSIESEQEAYVQELGNIQKGVPGAKEKASFIHDRLAILELERIKLERKLKKNEVSVSKTGTEFKYRGHFQFRMEGAENVKGVQNTRQSEQSFFRFRTYLTFTPNKSLDLNLTPQATKGFGADTAAGTSTSGSTTQTELFFFEANANYKATENLSAKIGRQELSYGDQLVIGSLAWDNNGRSFDAMKLNLQHGKGWTDLFYSKIADNKTPAEQNDDSNLFGLYNSWSLNQYLKNLDLYVLNQTDRKTAVRNELTMFGLRIKGEIGPVFYRTENGVQKGSAADGTNLQGYGSQYDFEIGAGLNGYKLSVEYAIASENYQQLYPTAHKFLGYADVLGRRNIEHMSIHHWGPITEKLSYAVDYHVFKRKNVQQSAYKLNGATAWGTNGTSDDIGNEIDFILNIKPVDLLTFQLGAALFNPGKYMKEQNNGLDENTNFYYAQMLAEF